MGRHTPEIVVLYTLWGDFCSLCGQLWLRRVFDEQRAMMISAIGLDRLLL